MKRSLGSRKGGIFIRLFFCALVVFAIGLGLHSLRSTSYGSVTVNKTATAKAPSIPLPASSKQIITPQFSLSYPERYTEKVSNHTTQWLFISPLSGGAGRSQLSILLNQLSTGALENETAFRYYAQHADLYKIARRSFGPNKAILATKLDGSSETAFLQNGDSFLTIAVSSLDNPDGLAAELDRVAGSVVWTND